MTDPSRSSLRLELAAAWLGAHRLLEQRLYETLGRWSAEVSEPEAKILLAAHSLGHAWHSRLWADRLPTLPHLVDADGAGKGQGDAGPTGAGWQGTANLSPSAARVEGIARSLEAVGSGGTLEKLAAVYRVMVPRLIVSYETYLRAASEVSDGPVIRALRLALFDESESWREGERLLQSLVVGREESERVARAQVAVEAGIAGSPGFSGQAG